VIALQKAYEAEMKLPFSNESNAETKLKTSSHRKNIMSPEELLSREKADEDARSPRPG